VALTSSQRRNLFYTRGHRAADALSHQQIALNLCHPSRRETRTVRFIGICSCVGIRQIDCARSNFYLAVRVSGIPRQKSVDSSVYSGRELADHFDVDTLVLARVAVQHGETILCNGENVRTKNLKPIIFVGVIAG
jgi:hypothetical protein